jgi:hypothetical protein
MERKEIKHKQNIQRKFHLKKMSFVDSPSFIDALAIYFIACSVLIDENMMNTLYIRDENTRNLLLNSVAPHFREVKKVYVENKHEVVNMQYVRKESVELFHSNTSHIKQLVHDIYRTKDMSIWQHEGKRDLDYYSVNLSELAPLAIPHTNEIVRYLTIEYLDQDEAFRFIPTGWEFEQSLKNSVALRFFSTFASIITLIVDKTMNQVIMVEITNN